MSEDLIKLFENESSFEIRKEIHNITNGLKLDLLVELNKAYYFDYLFKKLSEQVDKVPTESDEVLKKRLIEEGFEEVFDYVEFFHYTLENGLLFYSESKLKVQNVSLESYHNIKNNSLDFEIILLEYLNEIYEKQTNQSKSETLELKSDYIPNLALDKLPLNKETIKWFGIDYDKLTNEEIHEKLHELEKNSNDIYIDYENRFIYTGIHSCYDDILYNTILEELKIPMLHNLPKILEPIENEKIKNDLHRLTICKILEEQYQAKPKVLDLLISESINSETNLEFNPNNFNSDCYDLFLYLVDNYSKKGIIKFINIFYYLKNEVDKNKYSFKFIQSEYTEFIKKNYSVVIKKYQKAPIDFEEQKRVLNSLEQQFRKQ